MLAKINTWLSSKNVNRLRPGNLQLCEFRRWSKKFFLNTNKQKPLQSKMKWHVHKSHIPKSTNLKNICTNISNIISRIRTICDKFIFWYSKLGHAPIIEWCVLVIVLCYVAGRLRVGLMMMVMLLLRMVGVTWRRLSMSSGWITRLIWTAQARKCVVLFINPDIN